MGSLSLHVAEKGVNVVLTKSHVASRPIVRRVQRDCPTIKIVLLRNEWQVVCGVCALEGGTVRLVPRVVDIGFSCLFCCFLCINIRTADGLATITQNCWSVHVEPEAIIGDFIVKIEEALFPNRGSTVVEPI